MTDKEKEEYLKALPAGNEQIIASSGFRGEDILKTMMGIYQILEKIIPFVISGQEFRIEIKKSDGINPLSGKKEDRVKIYAYVINESDEDGTVQENQFP
ncbi:MAG: hypothetical protein E7241_05240 [Lachnospiraceae bacterium]|jgi:hypothetical protein|nr:hypothetical protein [Lachnospiraceae bacterium]